MQDRLKTFSVCFVPITPRSGAPSFPGKRGGTYSTVPNPLGCGLQSEESLTSRKEAGA